MIFKQGKLYEVSEFTSLLSCHYTPTPEDIKDGIRCMKKEIMKWSPLGGNYELVGIEKYKKNFVMFLGHYNNEYSWVLYNTKIYYIRNIDLKVLWDL